MNREWFGAALILIIGASHICALIWLNKHKPRLGPRRARLADVVLELLVSIGFIAIGYICFHPSAQLWVFYMILLFGPRLPRLLRRKKPTENDGTESKTSRVQE